MTRVTLHPEVQFAGDRRPTVDDETAMHHESHEQRFIARSVKTDARREPVGLAR